MSQINTRSATLDDLPILIEFEQGIIDYERPMDPTLKEDPISYYDLNKLISSFDSEVIVAIIDNEIIGSGYVKVLKAKPYLNHDRFGYIGFMFVQPKHRGKGVNKVINEALISWSRKQGLNEIRLEVYDQNDSAIKAYEKAGYSKNLVEMRMRI
ncbi:MAG: GNAT family N-acetyltransferase [Ekhidna sp.]